MKLSITRPGVDFESTPPGHRRATRVSVLARPDSLYRVLARRQIDTLIAENRRLRGAVPLRRNPNLLERLGLAYLQHRYPADPRP